MLEIIRRIFEVDQLISDEIEKIREELGDWFIDEYILYQGS
ncbi:MAG: hypothetical protein SVM80_07990 [Halobacteriota archaeon]|nr:hypothetical protein [Halobacteriota archaeon]